MKALMDNLDDLAGLDMVLLREAGFDRDAEPLREAPTSCPGWIAAIARLLRGADISTNTEPNAARDDRVTSIRRRPIR